MASSSARELSNRVEFLYAEYTAVHGPASPYPPDFPPLDCGDDAERKHLVKIERQVFEHVAFHDSLPEKLTDEQRWLLEWWIARRLRIEDAEMRLTYRAKEATSELFGEMVAKSAKQSAGGRASSKVIPELQEYVDRLVAALDPDDLDDPGAYEPELWLRIPEDDAYAREVEPIYRDGDVRVIVRRTVRGKEREDSRSRATFTAYVRRARKKLAGR